MTLNFTAVIKQHQNMNAAYIEPPFDVEEVFGSKRVKVNVTFDGIEYRGSIVKMGGIYMLGMTQEIRKKIGKDFGDTVEVSLQKDEEDRIVELPADFTEALADNQQALQTYDKLSYTAKREYVLWITDAKKADTRLNRIHQSLERLALGKKLRE